MRKLKLVIEIESNHQEACIEEIVDAVGSALDAGIAHAVSTVERGEGDDLTEAEIAASLIVTKPVIAVNPRVLFVVRDGVTQHFADDGVDIEVFDVGRQRAVRGNGGGVPEKFADLAIGARVPVGPN